MSAESSGAGPPRPRRGGGSERRLALAALAVVLLSAALIAWAGSREVAAHRALLLARALDAIEEEARSALEGLPDEAAGRIASATARAIEGAAAGREGLVAAVRSGTALAVLTDERGRPVAPALPPPAGEADRVSPELRAAIEAGRDIEHRFLDPASAAAHYARLLDAERPAPDEARLLAELAGTDAALGDWRAAAAVADRALALNDGQAAPLLGARAYIDLAVLRVEALARAGEPARASDAARRIARELAVAEGAGSYAGARFGLARLAEVLGGAPLPDVVARFDRAAGRALRQPGALEAAFARARGTGDGAIAVAVEGADGGGLLGARALGGDGGSPPRLLIVDAGLDAALAAVARRLEALGARLLLRDPAGARVAATGPAGAGKGGAAAARERIVALRGPLAGFSAELAITLPAAEERAAERETRALVAAFAAAGLAIAAAAFFVVRGATRAVQLERARAEFVAGVTHDLKTPLTLVRMYAETLRLGRAEGREDRERFLDVIMREADRLHALIENVLAFQRRGTALRLERTDIGATIRDAVAAFVPPREDPIGVDAAIAADLPPVAHDRSAVERILGNLLGNAARFAPPGSAVRVRVEKDGAGVRLAVADEGPGIAPDLLPRLFTPFTAGAGGGTGLGLATVRALAEAHGGSARVRPGTPRGTVAEVWLPARPPG